MKTASAHIRKHKRLEFFWTKDVQLLVTDKIAAPGVPIGAGADSYSAEAPFFSLSGRTYRK
jgi:hypothetical protein